MTEYWVSGAKFWCRYCKVFITDNKVTKRTHENGKKHKEKVEEYLQQVRKENQQQTREQNALNAEILRIQKAGIDAYRTHDLPPGFADQDEYVQNENEHENEQHSNFLSSVPVQNDTHIPSTITNTQQQIIDTQQTTITNNQESNENDENDKNDENEKNEKNEDNESENFENRAVGEPGQWTSVSVRLLSSSESEDEEEEEEEVKKPIKLEFRKKKIIGHHDDEDSDENVDDRKSHDPSFWSKKRIQSTENHTTKISFQLKKEKEEDNKLPVKKEEQKEEEKEKEEEEGVKIQFKKRKSGNQQFRRKVISQ